MTAPARDVTAPARLHIVVETPADASLEVLTQVFRRLGESLALAETRSGIVGCPRCGRRNRVPAAGTGVPVCGSCRHALPWIAAARDEDFAPVAEQASVPVLVVVWARWCGLSWLARPALERLALTRPGELKLVEVDVVAAPQETQRFAVRGVPTLLVLRRGELVDHRYAVAPAAELRDWVDAALPGAHVDGRA
ncbi:thioredoxin family protein [Pseudonocardia sp. T1-2H]|uniref:thioredoxin family protein n=1 Tax=Pseudonocardia sp. T1-2H TaxID=3128899 RepID=UPI0031011B9C